MSKPFDGPLAGGVGERAMTKQTHYNLPIYRIHRSFGHSAIVNGSGIQPAGNGFEMKATLQGLNYDEVTPPDVQIAAGPSNILEMVNLEGQVWAKDGVKDGPAFQLVGLYGTGSGFISDPKVMYDDSSDRWVASLTDISSSMVLVAVSTTGDPAGKFCLYNFTSYGGLIPDQPILGMSGDKIAISVNDFDPYSGQFAYSQFWIANKSQMMSCLPADFVSKTTPNYFSIHPVQSNERIPIQYMVSTSQNSTTPAVDVFAVRGVPPGPVSVTVSNFGISSEVEPPAAPQKGTNLELDTGDTRVQDARLQDGRLWMTFNDGCIPTGDVALRSCLHFVNLETGHLRVVHDIDFGIAGKYLFYPAIDVMPDSGKLFVVFGYSTHTDYPGIEAMVESSDHQRILISAIKTIQQGLGPIDLIFGCSVDRVCRYGDYFGAAQDPVSRDTVWAAGEFGSGKEDPEGLGMEWSTEMAKFTVENTRHWH